MAIRIDTFEMLEFEIPAGKDKWLEIELVPMDCWTPRQVEDMNAELAALKAVDEAVDQSLQTKLEELQAATPVDEEAVAVAAKELSVHRTRLQMNPNNNPVELNRFFLKFFNPQKAKVDAIDKLVPRYINAIAKEWEKRSGIDSGKSDDSTEQSSETVE